MDNAPKKLISDVISDTQGTVRSDLIDNESTRPQFLSRKRRDEFADLNTLDVRRSRKRIFLWAGVIIVAIVLFFVFSAIFTQAMVTVTPRTEHVSLNDTFTFYKETESEGPYFKVIDIDTEAKKDLPATGKKRIERKSSGTLIVFNEYQTKPLILIKNTRFESPNGNVYRIQGGITIPGAKDQTGKMVPGSLEVTVYADKPGEIYNIGLVDFTIPGFKGKPEYEKVYARSKTAMTGGFTGEVNVVSEADREATETELRGILEKQLNEKLNNDVPEGYAFLNEATKLDIQDLEEEFGSARTENIAHFIMRGSASGVLVSENELAKLAARSYVSGYQDEELRFVDASVIKLSMSDENRFDTNKTTAIEVYVLGESDLIWMFDEIALKSALAGQKKATHQDVFGRFPMIERAEIVIRPPWRRNFPDNAEKIRIVISGEN